MRPTSLAVSPWWSRPARQPAASTSRSAPTSYDPGRINIFERWESQATLETFRGSGPDSEQSQAMLTASVEEYAVADERTGPGGD